MLSKTDAEGVRAHNRRVVLNHLRRTGISTRRAISEATGLSMSSASSIASALVRDSILVEMQDNERDFRRGRPERRLVLRAEAARVAVVKIAVGEIAVRLCSYDGQTLAHVRREMSIADLDADRLVDAILELLAEVRAMTGASPTEGGTIESITVAVQGKTDPGEGRIVWSPAMRLRDLLVGPPLAEATGALVAVCNDCSLMPESFRWRSEGRLQNYAFVFIGFGVGMGLRVAGRNFGGQGVSTIEFGHINHIPGGAACRCGNRGCVEAYAGDYALWRRARGLEANAILARRISDAEMRQLAAEARSSEGAAREAFEEAGLAIGYGLGRIFTLIDPLPIVFTGSGAQAIDLLEPAIRRGITESSIAGQGADVEFSIEDDVDALVFEAAANHALAGIDERFATATTPKAEAAE
ncbi:ROK family protein [Jiella marina]|uniref:ROK family protein n=1 Tax=Jiella sp. LLJ827 TaxID=2917712 RepID=UPI002101288E|nr:ROK family protein [Jiella sp. LLJ827]MCQ0988776.1 ROK family protein [Jiella sp. LLJ827]